MEIVNIKLSTPSETFQNYESNDISLISTARVSRPFGLQQDYVEYFIYDNNGAIISTNYFVNSFTANNVDPVTGLYTALELNPEGDVRVAGYNRGTVKIAYNFFRKLFRSSITEPFWIKEISGDRTELRVCRQDLSNLELQQAFNDYNLQVSTKAYYPDFYLNFGGNRLLIAVNVLYALQNEEGCLLIKLYEPLPDDVNLKTTFWIVDKLSDEVAYDVSISIPVEELVEFNALRGPNYNVDMLEKVSQTTPIYNYTTLFQTTVSSSYQQLRSMMEEKGLDINIDYTDFSNFVHYSSATERITNFAYKASLIEQYENDITTLNTVSSNNNIITSGSKAVLQAKIDYLIEKFDGYEYYLYFESGSTAWPKTNTTRPYNLYSVTSSQALNWLGSIDTIPTATIQSVLYSASLYDYSNKDIITNTIPEYLKQDTANLPYQTFLNMIGQHFDNIWVYLKDVTERYDADNRLTSGISKDLIGDALRALGIKLYTNTSISDNIYYSMLAINPNGGTKPPTGSEYIDYYIPYAASGSYATGQTVSGDDITNKYYKRLYHNLPYLLKTRGTQRGLRALINCFGIPDTILRINEYGGSDKSYTTPDLVQKRHNLAYSNNGTNTPAVRTPWMGQYYYELLNSANKSVVPDTIEFRFKTNGIPTGSYISQSIYQLQKGNSTGTTISLGVNLVYDSSSAVPSSSYENYGKMTMYLGGDTGFTKTSPIYLPFYDKNLWWSVMIKRETGSGQAQNNTTSNKYWLYAKSATYNEEGNGLITFQGSQSIFIDGATSSSYNASWNTFSTESVDDIWRGYLGGKQNGGILCPNGIYFQGYFQDFRYWATPLSETAFDEHVINSLSYRGNTTTASLYDLTFWLPLGSNLNVPYRDSTGKKVNAKDYDLYELGITSISSSTVMNSYHPAITGTIYLPTTDKYYNGIPSFVSGTAKVDISYGIFTPTQNPRVFEPFEVIDLIPTPASGIGQKVNNKVTIDSGSNLAENVLSPYVSIQRLNQDMSRNVTDLEVGFSPSDVLDLDITSQLGYFNIDEYIGAPNDAYSSSYNSLDTLRNTYFQKYLNEYNVKDFIRLIKYYDNSLFKMIKDFVPARANVATGIIVKPHILERSKYTRNEPITTTDSYYTGSIRMVTISGSNPEDTYLNTSYTQSIVTPLGTTKTLRRDLKEPFTGNFNGNEVIGSEGNFLQVEVSSILTPWTSSVQNRTQIFTTYSINPLENNSQANVKSTYYLKPDYSSNPNIPVNLGIITGALALYPLRGTTLGLTLLSSSIWPFAEVGDYNWETYSRTNQRYEGSKLSSRYYNLYTSASEDYTGDKSYGNTAVVDKVKKKFGYLKKFSAPTLTLPDRGNAEIKYLIDKDQNVTDLSKTNPNIFDVQNIFKTGETLDISLFNYDTADPAIQRLSNNSTLRIYQGGYKYYPILHNLSGSHEQIFNFFPPLQVTTTTTRNSGGGGEPPPDAVTDPNNWKVAWYADSPVLNQHQFTINYTGPTGSYGSMPTGNYTASVAINFINSKNGLISQTANTAWQGPGTMPLANVKLFGTTVGIADTFIGGGAITASINNPTYFVQTKPGPPWYYVGGLDPVPSTKYTLSVLTPGGTGSVITTQNTYYTTTVSSSISQSCFYYLTASNSVAFRGAVAEYYGLNIIYSSSCDPYWSSSIMEPVAIPFTVEVGDELHVYSPEVGWYESEEYYITGKSIIGTGTGSRLIVGLDRPMNEKNLKPIYTDPLYGWATGSCRYIVVKKIPDETNVVVRYNPIADLVQEGMLYPQYIEPILRTSAGDIIQSLKSDNLI